MIERERICKEIIENDGKISVQYHEPCPLKAPARKLIEAAEIARTWVPKDRQYVVNHAIKEMEDALNG